MANGTFAQSDFFSKPRAARLAALGLFLLTSSLWFSSRALVSANFLPHWYCYAGNARVLWTTVIADLVIGLSYVTISWTLAVIVRRSARELPYQGLFWSFGLFIVSCGLTHFLEIVTIWKPVYWLAACAKIVTAVASAGTAAVLIFAANDIIAFARTARKLAEHRSDERFRALFNAAPLAVLSFDMEGRITSWNPAAEKIFGYAEREVIGRALPIVPEQLRGEHQRLLRTSLGGATTSAYETVRQRQDGSLVPVNAYAAPLHNEHGNRIGVMAALEDISERQRMEQDLLEKTGTLSAVTQALSFYLEGGWDLASKELLAFAIRKTDSENGFLAVAMDDGSLRILADNGAVWDQPIDRDLYLRAFHEHRDGVSAGGNSLPRLFAQVILSGQVVTSNHSDGALNDGLLLEVPPLHSFLGVPILRGHEVAGVLGLANRAGGYTGNEWNSLEAMSRATGVLCENYRQELKRRALEQKQQELEAQVRYVQKMEVLGRMAGGVAHDFNNMLMVLSGSAELLDRSMPREMLSRIYLEQIQSSVSKAAALTRQLLAFSRKQVLDIRPMNLHEAVREAATVLPALVGADVELVLRDAAVRSWIRSDPAQIEQVLINLAVNARDAMPGGGKLLIYTNNSAQPPSTASGAASEVADWVVLHVEDSGVGMDPQVLAQIFDPFFTTKPAGKGTGLGLSTVYGIVQQSSGHIEVESQPEQGTRFALYFPTIDAPQPQPPAPHPPEAPRHSGAVATLLLVDDEAALRHAIGEILRESGYIVLEASGPHEAVDIAGEHPGAIDLLVTDVIMPGMRGPELHQRVLELQPHIQVLFMSGYAEGLPEMQLPVGAAFLQKPFSFASLLRALRGLHTVN